MSAEFRTRSGAAWIGGMVLLGSLVLLAVSASEEPPLQQAEAGSISPLPTVPESLEGFRSEVWFLPAEKLLGFVEIPGGPFLMGSDPSADSMAYENERWSPSTSQGTVNVPTFYIGRYEVTVAQFQAFVRATGYPVAEESLNGDPDHPATHVSWPDALAYSRWLENTLRASPKTPPELQRLLREGWSVTLPSEAEWEKAARSDDARIFPWGDDPIRSRANFSSRSAIAVGRVECPECPFGLADMSGNVWEWTRSPLQPYPYDEDDDQETLENEALWIMRGGSYQDPVRNVRAAVRGVGDPGTRRPFVGFRLVITQP